jgi:hypothetical protein
MSTNSSSCVMMISWKFCWRERSAMRRARALARPMRFSWSRFVVGSSSVITPQLMQKVSASASRMTKLARTLTQQPGRNVSCEVETKAGA